MRSRRPSPEHHDAVSRRLALLSAELSDVRTPPPDPPPEGEWWDDHTRLATPRRLPAASPVASRVASPIAPPPVSAAAPPPVPVPGRHAARRPRDLGGLGGLVPATLRGRVLIGPAQLAVVAVLVAVGLGVTAWWVVRSDAAPAGEEPVAAAPAGALVPVEHVSSGPSPGVPGPDPQAAPATVTVDVAGKVRRPGIAVLDAGARVVDALDAAGGVRAGVDTAGLNLARVLVDGEQILVGVPPVAGVAAAAVPAAGEPAPSLVNLNTADGAQLETLPEVGPVTAASILDWRESHGGFTSVDELLEVDGIGEATLARIAPHVTV